MERFIVGNVIVALFPFSDLKGKKLRPALVLAKAEFGNLIICQITSKPYSSKTAIKLEANDFSEGNLPTLSYIRPDKLFTIDPSIIQGVRGRISKNKTSQVLSKVQKNFIP